MSENEDRDTQSKPSVEPGKHRDDATYDMYHAEKKIDVVLVAVVIIGLLLLVLAVMLFGRAGGLG